MPPTPLESPSDASLLRQFADLRSPQAFAALVERYLPLIYSSALRQTRDPHLAEDVAQATLIIFSQRAVRIDPPILVGWLLKTTHFVARNALRQQFRRARYEQRAAAMKSETQPPTESPNTHTDADAISNVIDPALAKLRDADRTAVVLRYFQNKSFADIAASLNTTEAAVQKRISRAVQKLRDILAGQGITVAPAALPALLALQKLRPVPASLSLHAATLSSSKPAITSSLAKGALKTMATATKLKISVATAVAILLVGVSVPTMYSYTHQSAQSQQIQPSAPAVVPVAWLPKGTDLSKPVSGSLPPGVIFEPIGIMRLADGRWMKPTGEPLTNPPADLSTRLAAVRFTGAIYAFLNREEHPIPGNPRSALSIRSSLLGRKSGSMNYWVDPKIQNREVQYDLCAFTPQRGANAVKLSIDVGDGAWSNVGTISPTAAASTQVADNGLQMTLYPPTESSKGVQIKFQESRVPPDQDTRFYVLTKSGEVLDVNEFENLPNSVMQYTFNGRLAGVQEVRLDARPYNYHAIYAAVPLPH